MVRTAASPAEPTKTRFRSCPRTRSSASAPGPTCPICFNPRRDRGPGAALRPRPASSRCGCFNPRRDRGPGAASIGSRAWNSVSLFQPSPGPWSRRCRRRRTHNRRARRFNPRRDRGPGAAPAGVPLPYPPPVSTLAGTVVPALPIGCGRPSCTTTCFNPRRDRGPGAARMNMVMTPPVVAFQPSPGPWSRRCLGAIPFDAKIVGFQPSPGPWSRRCMPPHWLPPGGKTFQPSPGPWSRRC